MYFLGEKDYALNSVKLHSNCCENCTVITQGLLLSANLFYINSNIPASATKFPGPKTCSDFLCILKEWVEYHLHIK